MRLRWLRRNVSARTSNASGRSLVNLTNVASRVEVSRTSWTMSDACSFSAPPRALGSVERRIAICGVDQYGNTRQTGHQLLQQFQPLRLKLSSERGEPRDVRGWMRQTRHDTAVDGVTDSAHDNGNRCCGLLRGEHGLGAPSENDVYFETNQIVRQLRKSLIAPSCIAVLETHVFSLDIAEITESLSKGIDGRQRFERQDTDGDYFPRLLRPRRERPRGRRAAEQRDELAPSQLRAHSISSNSILASLRSAVSKPSVNQP